MKLHQSGDKIIVTELRPMSDVPLKNRVEILAVDINYGKFNLLEYYAADKGWHNVTMCCAVRTLDSFLGWIPLPSYQPESKTQDKAALYEKIRKLNPREFAELHERNLRGEGSFDDLVSRLP